MKTFKYSARTEEGKEVKGTISARDEAAVTEILHDKGLVIVNIKDTFNFNIESLNEIGRASCRERV